MQTSIDLDCFDGRYTFRLSMAGIMAIEDKRGPIGEVYARVMAGRYSLGEQVIGNPLESRYSFADLVEIIRQGLIGGNCGESDGQALKVDTHKAASLIRTYVDPEGGNPVAKTWEMAAAVLFALIEGYEPAVDAQKKTETEKDESPSDSTELKSSPTDA